MGDLPDASGNPYEREDALRDYLGLHYGRPDETLPFKSGPREALGFPQRCAELVARFCRENGVAPGRALNVGCAVGGSSFALARDFAEVVAVDLSERFIAAAGELKDRGQLEYFRRDEGDLGERVSAEVDPAVDRSRVQFRWADACALPADLMNFDAVLGANLLCRLPSPRAFLDRLGGARGLVRPGGLLVLTTPCTWMESFTPREAWLGGLRRDGVPISTLDGLRAALGSQFELLVEEDVPLLIREHRRKYQYIVSLLTAWRRREG